MRPHAYHQLTKKLAGHLAVAQRQGRIILLVALAAGSQVALAENSNALNDETIGTTVNATISFKKHIVPQLINRCAYCHQAYDRHGYLVIEEESAYSALVNVASYQLPSMLRVKPYEPENSYLWLKGTDQHLEAGGYGWRMPLMSGIYGPFKEQLYSWIKQGAKNN